MMRETISNVDLDMAARITALTRELEAAKGRLLETEMKLTIAEKAIEVFGDAVRNATL